MTQLNKDFMYLLRPREVGQQIRLGGKNDGGYVVPTIVLNSINSLVSFGYGNDSKFERDFLKLDKRNKVNLYESSINLRILVCESISHVFYFWRRRSYITYRFKKLILYFLLRLNRRISYKNLKVTDIKKDKKDISILEILSNIFNYQNLCLKIDIEGGEYKILPLIDFKICNFSLLIIEFHQIQEKESEFLSVIESLKTHYVNSNLHINNFGSVIGGIPDVIEICFIRSNFAPTLPVFSSYIPNDLDNPCNPNSSEIKYVYL